jgi:hypothetical protein
MTLNCSCIFCRFFIPNSDFSTHVPHPAEVGSDIHFEVTKRRLLNSWFDMVTKSELHNAIRAFISSTVSTVPHRAYHRFIT